MSKTQSMPETALKQAHKRSFRNAECLKASEQAGCFHCLSVYPAHEVREYVRETGEGRTAVCPRCGIDSVIGSAAGYPLTREFLSAMEQYWFGDA